MSYSFLLKKELCAVGSESECCQLAEAYGLMLYSKLITEKKSSYSSDNKAIVDLISHYAAAVCGVYVDVLIFPARNRDKSERKERFSVKIPDEEQRKALCAKFAVGEGGILAKDCCLDSFLRGAFIVCGTAADPEKGYHLEFLAGSERKCDILAGVMKRIGVRSYKLDRGERWVLYVKDAVGVERLIEGMGAQNALERFRYERSRRDSRNTANRQANCDNANINRIVAASERQCAAIKKLMSRGGISGIPPELRELAALRLENPEMSLSELSENLSEPISRSGVNHRLKKLIELAEETGDKEEKTD